MVGLVFDSGVDPRRQLRICQLTDSPERLFLDWGFHQLPNPCFTRCPPTPGVRIVGWWCDVGPLEVLVIECPGDKLKSDIVLALTSAVDGGSLRIIDVTFVYKDAQGNLSSYELAELEEHELVAYDVVDETRGLLSVGDIAKIGARVSPNSSAVLMVVEHAWTAYLEQGVLAASGRIVVHERVATDVARAALEYDRSARAGDRGDA